jgi:prevent-host-death family protein
VTLSPLDNTIGASEAKTHFAELLERVAGGEEVTITRHGVPVAKLSPIQRVATKAERRRAIDAILALAKHNRLDGLKIKDLINEGRP